MDTIKGCIFDLDGVICSTDSYHYLAWKRLARKLGFDFTQYDNERMKNLSRRDALEILLEVGGLSFDDHIKEALAEKKNKWFKEYINNINEDDLQPGVKDFLTLLKNNNVKILVNSISKNLPIILQKLNLSNYFDAVLDDSCFITTKIALDSLDLDPSSCVIFNESSIGIDASKEAGIRRSVGVGLRETFEDCDFVIDSFEGLTLTKLYKM